MLPLVLGGDIEDMLRQGPAGVPKLGVRAGLFHYTTSYSLPFAVRCAELIAQIAPLTSAHLNGILENTARRHWQTQRLFRLLNRLLFLAAEPGKRYRVLERFYKLPQPLIERFYSSRLSFGDHARILVGKPPVPITRALRFVHEAAVPRPLVQPGSQTS